MFKQIIVSLAAISVFAASIPAEAAFGGSSRSSSSYSSRSSSSYSSPSRSYSSSSSSRPSSSYSSSSSSSASKSGSFGSGQSLGMTRPSVTQSVRDGSYTRNVPANNSTVAGSGRTYNSNPAPTYTNNRYYSNGGTGYYNGGYYSGGGHSTGTLLGVAAAAGLAGYLLHRDNSGNVYYTQPGNPNVAYTPNGQVMSAVPQGDYAVAGTVPVEQASGGHPFIWFLVGIILLLVIAAFLMAIFKKKTEGDNVMFGFGKNAEEALRDSADDFFINFQKNNRPSQLGWIQQNTAPMLFEAVRDDVANSNENREIKVVRLNHTLINLEEEGTQYVATVLYDGVVRTTENGQTTDEDIKQNWNFIHKDGRWLLAGIEQI